LPNIVYSFTGTFCGKYAITYCIFSTECAGERIDNIWQRDVSLCMPVKEFWKSGSIIWWKY